jgi:hypothetical protein
MDECDSCEGLAEIYGRAVPCRWCAPERWAGAPVTAPRHTLPVITEVREGERFWCDRLSVGVSTTACNARRLARTADNRQRAGWALYPSCEKCPEGAALAARLGAPPPPEPKVAPPALCIAKGCKGTATRANKRTQELKGFCRDCKLRAYYWHHKTAERLSYAAARARLLGGG